MFKDYFNVLLKRFFERYRSSMWGHYLNIELILLPFQ